MLVHVWNITQKAGCDRCSIYRDDGGWRYVIGEEDKEAWATIYHGHITSKNFKKMVVGK